MLTITSSMDRQTVYTALPSLPFYTVVFNGTVTESNAALSSVGASLDWNDGTPPVAVPVGASPLVIADTRSLAVGTYFITLRAWNYQEPTPGQAVAYFNVQIQPELAAQVINTYLYGPILPMDDKYPGPNEWNFNLGNNIDVLKSSIKMLLITTKGERVMQPTYGTYLRRIVFELNDSSIAATIRQEIDEALNQFEPRAMLESFDVTRDAPRQVVVLAKFLSKLEQTTFSLTLPFNQ